MRKIEDLEVEGKYQAMDFTWLLNKANETEKLAVSLSKNGSIPDQDNIDNANYILNIYSMEKKLQSKYARSEIKVVESEQD